MKTKIVYQFKEDSREYAGEQIAFESPLEPGHYPMPLNCTDITPPTAVSGTAIVFYDNAWHHIVDNRGVWQKQDGSLYEITSVYESADAGWIKYVPSEEMESNIQQKSPEYQKIISALEQIDLRSIRPIREGNRNALQQLENEAALLRIELKKLQG
jgi:hypothetical protein